MKTHLTPFGKWHWTAAFFSSRFSRHGTSAITATGCHRQRRYSYSCISSNLGFNDSRNRTFSVKNCSMMKGLQSLNPTSIDFLCLDKVQLFGTFFDANVENLNHDVPQAKHLLDRKFTTLGKEVPQCLLELTAFIKPYRDVFQNAFDYARSGSLFPSLACLANEVF